MSRLASLELTCSAQIVLAVVMMFHGSTVPEWDTPWRLFWLAILVINAIVLVRHRLARRKADRENS